MPDAEGDYATVIPYGGDLPPWVPEDHGDRIRAYFKYDDMYWSAPDALKLMLLEDDNSPIFVPKPRTIVDTTSHYMLKGLTCMAPTGNVGMQEALDAFIKRERFYSVFHIAKHSGVSRGDWIIHLRADETKIEGTRVSMNSVHPASYFPVYDPLNPDKLIKVHLAEEYEVIENGQKKVYLRRLTYEYEYPKAAGGTKKVWRTEGVFETKDWFDPEKETQIQSLLKRTMLPEEIQTIPVYVFPNSQWQGRDFGTSELAGFERLFQAIDQTVSDEEVTLALEGLGVYATDAAGPIDPTSRQPIPWEVAPGRVIEVPTGSYFRRVEGVGTITPMIDHVKYLQEALFEASGTSDIARGIVDVQVAQSGIALALKFLPTLAKIEERDETGLGILAQFWWDWKAWTQAFESTSFGDLDEVALTLGDKLPTDKTAKLNELNNMFDRGIIPAVYYREEATKLGYVFPDDIENLIAKEADEKFKRAQEMASLNNPTPDEGGGNADPGAGKSGVAGRPKNPPSFQRGNRSNNKNRTNESGGTEAK